MAQASPTTAGSTGIAYTRTKSPAFAARAAAVLTTSYVASSHVETGAPNVGVFVTLASVDYTSIEILPEVSPDGTNWFEVTDGATAVTLANLQSATDGLYAFKFSTAGARYARVKAKRTGGTATGTVGIQLVAGTES